MERQINVKAYKLILLLEELLRAFWLRQQLKYPMNVVQL